MTFVLCLLYKPDDIRKPTIRFSTLTGRLLIRIAASNGIIKIISEELLELLEGIPGMKDETKPPPL